MHPQFYEASITIVLATSLAIYTLVHGEPGRSRRLFIGLISSIIVWSGGVALSRVFPDPEPAFLAVCLSFIGIFALPPIWYGLALHLTGRTGDAISRRRLAAIGAPSVAALLALATNPWHHLYVADPSTVVELSPQEWAGPLFWVWMTWAYLLVFAASVRYVGWSWRLVSNDARWRGLLVALASVLPLSGNVAHVWGWTDPGHDFTPLLLGVATVMLFVADWRFRLLDTLPVARRDVIEQLRDGVLVAAADGILLDMNPAAERMMEATLAELRGKPMVHAVSAQSKGRFDLDEDAFNRAVLAMCTSVGGFETRVENYAGRHFEIRGASVGDSGGRVSGFYIIMRDVTDRSRFDEAQRESRRAQSIASLAAGITHEVNNPLSYVRANVNHVLDELAAACGGKLETTDELQGVLEEALEGIDRIGTIVERVRKFTHTRGTARESISIAGVFEEVARIRARSPGPAVEVAMDVAPDVGPVLGHRDGLLEAVLNLVDNAQHALRETGGVIRLRARRRRGQIRIEIEDDGPGVPEEMRQRIFEPFFTTGDHRVGTGLGLTISVKLVADFGGTLNFEPVDGDRGARFVIELPEPGGF